jgi:Ca2+-binding EF-hand superfamily protein
MKISTLSILLALTVGSAAWAQARPGADGGRSVSRQQWLKAAGMRFDRLDANKDGVLTPDELARGRQHGPQGRHSFSRMDTNGDGQISLDEFHAAHPRAPADLFTKLDTNKDGRLSPAELRGMHAQAVAQMREKLFERLDANHDGSVSLAEMQAVRPNMTAEQFNRLDRNGNGELTADELPLRHGFRGGFGAPPPARTP